LTAATTPEPTDPAPISVRAYWPERRPKLMIFDDQQLNLRVLHRLFKDDCQIEMAMDGNEAVQRCLKFMPDLILLDVEMPGKDGFTVCRELKKDPVLRPVPVIFITGRSSDEDESEGLALGAVDFITKPITPPIVRARVRTHLMLRGQARLMHELAFRDALTGVANRRRFDEHLKLQWRAAVRSQQPLSALLIDVDGFKAYNDHYGHLAGDDALRNVARALSSGLIRPGDFLARYGGEEFVALLPESRLDQAAAIAEQLRERVQQMAMPHACSPNSEVMTVSIGIATLIPQDRGGSEVLLQAADSALYAAKHAGRNQVCTALEEHA